jgi:hypothetical protein
MSGEGVNDRIWDGEGRRFAQRTEEGEEVGRDQGGRVHTEAQRAGSFVRPGLAGLTELTRWG